MEIHRPLPLLGGLSAQQFMRRHWQKKPLLVRQAVPAIVPPIARAALFAMAEREEVESRLIRRSKTGWVLRHGPLPRRAVPSLKQPGWTMLVQGVDLHDQRVHELLQQFRFVPDARLDDLMISYASDEGGVGPHFDSYDVFLLQVHGRRRWSIGKPRDLRLESGVPLKILARFEPEQSFVLEPGDMLYLPPRYAHEGVAVGGDCMTYSIGLRAPAAAPLGADLLS
ncbi:MAG: cupin domain-containing protein, partial [Variovorax sp.]